MTKITTGSRGLKPHIIGARVGLWSMSILAVALIPSLIVLAIAQTKPAFAATHTTDDSNPIAVAAELTDDEEPDLAEVWCATLTVGYSSDSTITYLGYTPALALSGGSLDNTAFTYEDVDYTVENLFYQDFAGTVRQVIFEANYQLPDELILRLGDDEFFVSDSLVLGANENIHAWRLESGLGWVEGQTVEATLRAPQSQEAAVIAPEGDRIIPVNGSLNGEFTGSNDLDVYTITIEDNRRYVIDMKGAETGDGTLPDPWISAISAVFDTEDGSRREPVWYDDLRRTSTFATLPGGSVVWMDENSRMYKTRTAEGRSTVVSPGSGANDDGGEGFNARLFLFNFPAGDYFITVGAAENPTALGTYAISLTDMSEDDYAAVADGAGSVLVGESVSGDIETPGDVDWIAVDLTAGAIYVIEIKGQLTGDGTLRGPRLQGIYDSEGSLVEGTGDGNAGHGTVRNASLEFTPEDDGTYYIAAAGFRPYMPNRSDIPIGTYTVEVSVKQ